MTDYTELKRAAEAADQGRWNQDGFEVQNDDIEDYRVARCNRLTDATFIAAANPAAVLELIAEIDRLREERDSQQRVCIRVMEERDQIRAEVHTLRANSDLQKLLPDLDYALEELEMHGKHSDQGYRKLRDWYRKVSLACKAVDDAMSKERGQ